MLVARPRGRVMWASGALRHGRRSIRVRESLGVRADRPRRQVERALDRLHETLRRRLENDRAEVTFAEAAASYLEAAARDRPSDRPLRLAREVVHVTRHFADVTLAEVTTDALNGYVGTHHEGKKAGTINRHLVAASAVPRHAHGRRDAEGRAWLPAVPAIPRVTPTPLPKEERFFCPDEFKAFLAAMSPHLRGVVRFAAAAGSRAAETVAPDRTDVSFRRGEVTFRRTKNGEDRVVALAASALETVERRNG